MNKLLFFSAALVLTVPLVPAQETTTSNLSRDSYIDRSDQDIRNLRKRFDQVAAQTPLASQAQLAPARDALEAAEDALAQYKIASDTDRPARRSDFERARAEATRTFNDLKSQWDSSRSTSNTENPVRE